MYNYRNILKEFLAEKQKSNSQFSMRSMARKLELAPSMLSGVMRGDKNLSVEKAYAVADKLELSGRDTELFLRLVELERAKDPKIKERIYQSIQESFPESHYIDLSLEKFKIISEWYHFAILQLTLTRPYPANAKEMADRLDISTSLVELAIERLLRVGLLIQNEDGKYQPSNGRIKFTKKEKNESLRSFHKQTITKAMEAIETQTNDEKFIASETFPFSAENLVEANKILDEAFTKILYLAEASSREDVYHLGVQLFKLTKTKKDRRLQ